MKFNFENILPDPDSFWSAEEVKTETKQSVSPKPRSSDSVSMESVTAARKRDFANENYSDEEPNFLIMKETENAGRPTSSTAQARQHLIFPAQAAPAPALSSEKIGHNLL